MKLKLAESKSINESIKSTIEIDCDPYSLRPDTHFKDICDKILKVDYYDPISTAFGNWEWNVEYKDEDQREEVKKYLVDLYNEGAIRYASW